MAGMRNDGSSAMRLTGRRQGHADKEAAGYFGEHTRGTVAETCRCRSSGHPRMDVRMRPGRATVGFNGITCHNIAPFCKGHATVDHPPHIVANSLRSEQNSA